MPDYCGKLKNPCMVCGRTVTNKTGLQCQGSCQAWIHYTCCNYTPGKIKDIKAKIIKVRCPCPNCAPQFPKEEIVQKDFSCLNVKCPANVPPKCEHKECPSNKISQIPSTSQSQLEWPGVPCGAACKKHSSKSAQRQGCFMGDLKSPSPSRLPSPCPATQPRREPVLPSFSFVENMCETVGLLSNQLNQLMCKMADTLGTAQGAEPKPCGCNQHSKRK